MFSRKCVAWQQSGSVSPPQVWVLDKFLCRQSTSALYDKPDLTVDWSSYIVLKSLRVKGTLPFSRPIMRTPPHINEETLGSWGRMPQRSGAACCLYQEVRREVKNLIPPPLNNYIFLGTVSSFYIPLYMTTSHLAVLLTINSVAGADWEICVLFISTSMSLFTMVSFQWKSQNGE